MSFLLLLFLSVTHAFSPSYRSLSGFGTRSRFISTGSRDTVISQQPLIHEPALFGKNRLRLASTGVDKITLQDEFVPNWMASNKSLRKAVRDWDKNQREAKAFYGPIGTWNTSQVTDMSKLFMNLEGFNNEEINDWDVSHVTNMENMFNGCSTFNKPLDKWNVSQVTSMKGMFKGCERFNQSLNHWKVSKVTSMEDMFIDCVAFNQPLNDWDVSNVESMAHMFYHAFNFNQPLDRWNTSKVIS